MLCLTRPTDPAWTAIALADLPSLLADHAHCEIQAASNALSLAARSPAFPAVARAMLAVADEELRHARLLFDVLERRGLSAGKPEEDAYAVELRRVATATARGDAELGVLYEELFASEARHDRLLVDLAVATAGDEPRARDRLEELARLEGEIVAGLGARATVHG